MKVIVDTNIIFSLLLKSGHPYLNILSYNENDFYSCKYCFVELFKHKEKIIKYSKMPEAEILELLYQILVQIHFLDERIISNKSYFHAHNLCKDIDSKDISFITLTLELEGHLWTRDSELADGLKLKGFDRFFTLE